MRPNKVLQFAEKQKSKSWVNVQFTNMRPSVDPNIPPLYIIDVQGQRGDGLVFTIPVTIDKAKFDLLPAAKALEVGTMLLNQGIKQLMTFTGCGCTQETECEQHRKAAVN